MGNSELEGTSAKTSFLFKKHSFYVILPHFQEKSGRYLHILLMVFEIQDFLIKLKDFLKKLHFKSIL